mgnify:CR=1 FL=1
MNLRWIGLVFLAIVCKNTNAQFEFLPLSNESENIYNHQLFSKSTDFHSSVKPYRRSEVNKITNRDSIIESKYYQGKFYNTWLGGAVFNKDFLTVRTKDFDLSINPIFNFNGGMEMDSESGNTFVNTRGLSIEGRIGDEVTFFTAFTENQARYADYINGFVNSSGVVPGQGVARDFKEDAYDFSNAYGMVSYTPNKFFNFSLGQGKQFFGEGYRTMFVGDGAFNYPFFKIETTVWKIKYVNLWTQQRDIRKDLEVNQAFRKKWTSMHYLSWNVNSRLNINLFESVIYGSDTNNRGIEASFFNPVILYRPIEFANGSDAANVLIGIGASYKLADGLVAYGQFSLDEFVKAEMFSQPGSWRNKYAGQLGLKYYNAFKVPRLFLQGEFNSVRPYMYSHIEGLTNHGHYGQPMAHIWGGNFNEIVLRTNYSYNRWVAELQINIGAIGNDTGTSNWGKDIYQSYNTRERDDNNEIGQGVTTNLMVVDAKIGYIINPSYNLRVEAGITARKFSPEVNVGDLKENNTLWFHFGLRTALFNNYYDF